MATSDPWADFRVGASRPGANPYAPDPYSIPPDPVLARRAEDEERRRQQAAAIQAAEAQARLGAQPIANQGNMLDNERKRRELAQAPVGDPAAAQKVASLDAMVTQINRVQELFNSGQAENAVPLLGSLYEYLPTPANTQFDTAAAGLAEQGLAAFRVPGVGAQSDAELRQFVDANKPSTWSNDSSNLERLRQLRVRVDETRQALGLPPAQWSGLPDQQQQQQRQDQPPPGVIPPTGGNTGGNGQPPPVVRPWSPDAPTSDLASGGTRTVEANPAIANEYRARLAANQSADEIVAWLRSQNQSEDTIRQARAQIRYRQDNPNVPIESYYIGSTNEVPLSMYERAMTAAGGVEAPNGFNPAAYTLGAGQFLSMNTLDNMAADPERARQAAENMRQANPGSTLAGEISGGVMGSLTGEAALARLGMAPGFVRGLLADTAMGAGNGAGAADNGNRLEGASEGGFAAAVGSALGAGASKAATGALSPTGAELRPLYDAGVRPTPGQRFAGSGVAGRVFNTAEEGLQSVPIVGQAIRGARQEARDQFQIGAFNEALGEIGEQLPRGMRPGTDPNAFAQTAFNRTYDKARSAMHLVADEELSNELGQLAPDIATLGPQAQRKLKAIMQNTVNNRVRDGAMAGGAYKQSVADLGRHTARLRASPMAEDQALADVLDGVRGALDSAARRHSPPEAIALLDAADAGYAKLVRIEEAARRRGGDAGTFSPANFDSAVQRASGGVRSKAYLRGDALMQDYAKAGRSLEDTLPNSGTADRAMLGGAATGVLGGATALGAVPPWAIASLGAIATAYAPGIRRAMKGALAPPGPARKAIARQLEKRSRLLGTMGAGFGVASLLGTGPDQ